MKMHDADVIKLARKYGHKLGRNPSPLQQAVAYIRDVKLIPIYKAACGRWEVAA